jgi:hypothetical protein
MKHYLFTLILAVLNPCLGISRTDSCSIERMLSHVPDYTSQFFYTDIFLDKYYYSLTLRERKRYEISKSDVLCLFVKDETELGEYYSHPDMEDPSLINSGYIKYDFHALCKFPILNNLYSFIYRHNKDEWYCTYLCVFSHDKKYREIFPVKYFDEIENYCFRSLISISELTIMRVTYCLIPYNEGKIEPNYTKIIKEYFYYDFMENQFVKLKSEDSKSDIYFNEFIRDDNYMDDPFSSYNMEQTKSEFEEFNKTVRTLRNLPKAKD